MDRYLRSDMAKNKTIFSCTNCDAQSPQWSGRCLDCGKWGTVEERSMINDQRSNSSIISPSIKTTKLKSIKQKDIARTTTTMSELDRVLGGGLVKGSLVLLGGEPGIGKSTLSIQIAAALPSLYISGEESIEQIKMRADRLGLTSDTLELANEMDIHAICATMIAKKPGIVIIDSIQTIQDATVSGTQGSPAQVRTCTGHLMETAKKHGITTIIIGHVTKDGSVAGPKTLEHLVDTVLYLGGDRFHSYRMLRTAKNRFGPTDEVGIFDMTPTGLKDVNNASEAFLQEREEGASGSVITCLMEGTRPVLIEVQALVNKTSFGYPVRKASGFDLNRLHVLAAVLEKRAKLNLGDYDIHINVVGGIKANEPAADLAVCLAIASSYKDKALGNDLVVFGEVGLSGEVRKIQYAEKRIKESKQLGIKRAIISSHEKVSDVKDMKLITVKNIAELIMKT